MGGTRLIVAGLCLALLAGPAQACVQGQAVYTDSTSGHSVTFRGDQGFAVSIEADGPINLDGYILIDATLERPTGIVMHDCPEGDVTGEEIAACTIWNGAIYAIDAEGTIGMLPQTGAPAADKVLLADFGRSLAASTFGERYPKTAVPWDVFEMTGCTG
jgi:hypothetical protein